MKEDTTTEQSFDETFEQAFVISNGNDTSDDNGRYVKVNMDTRMSTNARYFFTEGDRIARLLGYFCSSHFTGFTVDEVVEGLNEAVNFGYMESERVDANKYRLTLKTIGQDNTKYVNNCFFYIDNWKESKNFKKKKAK